MPMKFATYVALVVSSAGCSFLLDGDAYVGPGSGNDAGSIDANPSDAGQPDADVDADVDASALDAGGDGGALPCMTNAMCQSVLGASSFCELTSRTCIDCDADGDSFPTAADARCASMVPVADRDCDDARADVYPGAPAVCGDGFANNCRVRPLIDAVGAMLMIGDIGLLPWLELPAVDGTLDELSVAGVFTNTDPPTPAGVVSAARKSERSSATFSTFLLSSTPTTDGWRNFVTILTGTESIAAVSAQIRNGSISGTHHDMVGAIILGLDDDQGVVWTQRFTVTGVVASPPLPAPARSPVPFAGVPPNLHPMPAIGGGALGDTTGHRYYVRASGISQPVIETWREGDTGRTDIGPTDRISDVDSSVLRGSAGTLALTHMANGATVGARLASIEADSDLPEEIVPAGALAPAAGRRRERPEADVAFVSPTTGNPSYLVSYLADADSGAVTRPWVVLRSRCADPGCTSRGPWDARVLPVPTSAQSLAMDTLARRGAIVGVLENGIDGTPEIALRVVDIDGNAIGSPVPLTIPGATASDRPNGFAVSTANAPAETAVVVAASLERTVGQRSVHVGGLRICAAR